MLTIYEEKEVIKLIKKYTCHCNSLENSKVEIITEDYTATSSDTIIEVSENGIILDLPSPVDNNNYFVITATTFTDDMANSTINVDGVFFSNIAQGQTLILKSNRTEYLTL